eukprot:753982-Hanusia_phi.AAC.1
MATEALRQYGDGCWEEAHVGWERGGGGGGGGGGDVVFAVPSQRGWIACSPDANVTVSVGLSEQGREKLARRRKGANSRLHILLSGLIIFDVALNLQDHRAKELKDFWRLTVPIAHIAPPDGTAMAVETPPARPNPSRTSLQFVEFVITEGEEGGGEAAEEIVYGRGDFLLEVAEVEPAGCSHSVFMWDRRREGDEEDWFLPPAESLYGAKEERIYSQNGEDGILLTLLGDLGLRNDMRRRLTYVEIGVGDGSECNSRILREQLGARGLMFDMLGGGGGGGGGGGIINAFVSPAN